jgi:hypothetical protein
MGEHPYTTADASSPAGHVPPTTPSRTPRRIRPGRVAFPLARPMMCASGDDNPPHTKRHGTARITNTWGSTPLCRCPSCSGHRGSRSTGPLARLPRPPDTDEAKFRLPDAARGRCGVSQSLRGHSNSCHSMGWARPAQPASGHSDLGPEVRTPHVRSVVASAGSARSTGVSLGSKSMPGSRAEDRDCCRHGPRRPPPTHARCGSSLVAAAPARQRRFRIHHRSVIPGR